MTVNLNAITIYIEYIFLILGYVVSIYNQRELPVEFIAYALRITIGGLC